MFKVWFLRILRSVDRLYDCGFKWWFVLNWFEDEITSYTLFIYKYSTLYNTLTKLKKKRKDELDRSNSTFFFPCLSVKQLKKIYYKETLNRSSKRVSQAIDKACKRLLRTKLKNILWMKWKLLRVLHASRFTMTSSVIVSVVVLDAAERQYRFLFVVMTTGIVSHEKHVAHSTPCY